MAGQKQFRKDVFLIKRLLGKEPKKNPYHHLKFWNIGSLEVSFLPRSTSSQNIYKTV